MLRRSAFSLLPALAVTAIAVTGCGGSSKKSSSNTTTTTTTSTVSGSTGGSINTSGLSTSTPLNSALAQKLFREEGITHGLTPSQATKFVACLEKKFAAQGLNTFGDASSNGSQTRLDSAACALNVKTGG